MAKKRVFKRRAKALRERVAKQLHVLRLRVTERVRARRVQLADWIRPE